MRAAVLHKPGDICLEDIAKPEAKAGEALLRVAAVGVCGSDIPRMLTKGAHRMPLVCRHEFSGHIAALGADVTGFEVGELVGVVPLIPCRVCDQCATGNFSRCRDYDYFGSRRDGAYTEFVAEPVGNLLKAPKGADPRAVIRCSIAAPPPRVWARPMSSPQPKTRSATPASRRSSSKRRTAQTVSKTRSNVRASAGKSFSRAFPTAIITPWPPPRRVDVR